jgi:hypothetical protein
MRQRLSQVRDRRVSYPERMVRTARQRAFRSLNLMLLASVLAGTQGCIPQTDPALARTPPPSFPITVIAPPAAAPDIAGKLAALAPDANPEVVKLAVQAHACAVEARAVSGAERLAVIDYSRPSTERRLWVFDLARERLLYSEHVAHGRNTGDNLATRFSNIEGSLQSSLGLFRTAETYDGENGYSLRMDGLEPGVNDLARPRAIVMHGAWYVDPTQARRQGRLGRSLGCPALRTQVAREVIDTLKQGQLLFAYYPDRTWLSNSRFLACRPHEPARAGGAGIHAAAH